MFAIMCMRACAVIDRSRWANINLRGKIIDVWMCRCLVNYSRYSELRLEGKFDLDISLHTLTDKPYCHRFPLEKEKRHQRELLLLLLSLLLPIVIRTLFFLSLHRFHSTWSESTPVWSLFLFTLTTFLTIVEHLSNPKIRTYFPRD